MTQMQLAKKALAQKKRRPPPEKQGQPLTITVKEAARRLGISEERGYAAAAAGHIPTMPMGKRKVVPVAALERMLAEVKAKVEAA